MLSILLDAGVLMFLVAAVNENDEVEFVKAAIVAIILSIGIGVAMGVTVAAQGPPAMYLGAVLSAVVAGLIAWVAFGLTLQRAMILGGLFMLWMIGRSLLFQWMFST